VHGKTFQRTFTDWTARIFQHEYDHLQVHIVDSSSCACKPPQYPLDVS